VSTNVLGIFQSEIVLTSAIRAALRDMKRKQWLLDFVFANIADDPLTVDKHGKRYIDLAKDWFCNSDNKIKVYTNITPEDARFPCVTLSLSSTVEAEATLGDIHYQPTEAIDSSWPSLSTEFTPVSFLRSTGKMVLPEITGNQVRLTEGLLVLTKDGQQFEITEVLDDNIIRIAANVEADFTGAVIKPPRPAFTAHIESIFNKETWVIGCHVQTEPLHLTFLHSILVFALHRYKQSLLEKRGFERMSFSSSDFIQNPHITNQRCFTRYINLSGYVHQGWVKDIMPNVTNTEVLLGVSPSDNDDGSGDDLDSLNFFEDDE
jgi:hypothetical protein